MRSKRLLRGFICIITCTMLMSVQPLTIFAAGSDTNRFARMDDAITKQMKQNHIPELSTGIVKGDKLLPWFKAFYQNKPTVITMRHQLNQIFGVPAFHDHDVDADTTIKQIVKEVFKNLEFLTAPKTGFFYAMGWGVNYKNGEIDIIEHTGETSNYHAHAIIKEDIAIIEMDHMGGFIIAAKIAPDSLEIIQNRQPSTYNPQGASILLFNMFHLINTLLLVVSIIRLINFKYRITKSKLGFYSNMASLCL